MRKSDKTFQHQIYVLTRDNNGVDLEVKAEGENGNCITGFISIDFVMGLSAVFLIL